MRVLVDARTTGRNYRRSDLRVLFVETNYKWDFRRCQLLVQCFFTRCDLHYISIVARQHAPQVHLQPAIACRITILSGGRAHMQNDVSKKLLSSFDACGEKPSKLLAWTRDFRFASVHFQTFQVRFSIMVARTVPRCYRYLVLHLNPQLLHPCISVSLVYQFVLFRVRGPLRYGIGLSIFMLNINLRQNKQLCI